MNHCHYLIFVDREYFDKYDDDHLMYLCNHVLNIRFHAIRIDMLHLYEMKNMFYDFKILNLRNPKKFYDSVLSWLETVIRSILSRHILIGFSGEYPRMN